MTNDPALIEAARQGDEAALLRLLETSQPDLHRIAATQCASSADADDAVQETLLLVYRRIGALRTVTSYTAWLFAIVRRECHRLMRRMHGQVELPADDHPIFAYYTTPDLRADLAAAIQSLPDKYREAIVLRDFEEYSIAEIANDLRLSREAVKSRIHRGRGMIREYLRD
ncbi:MAG: RNA polymerase sigma factor [Rhodanobacteraceae bacterium]|nr:MAG: RNA polymerase sigma factor [Rhodanobacteraceae bacterium]